jgi:hypothetical protein
MLWPWKVVIVKAATFLKRLMERRLRILGPHPGNENECENRTEGDDGDTLCDPHSFVQGTEDIVGEL